MFKISKLIMIITFSLILLSCSDDGPTNPGTDGDGNGGGDGGGTTSSVSVPNSDTEWAAGGFQTVKWDASKLGENNYVQIDLFRGEDSVEAVGFFNVNDGEDSVYIPQETPGGDNYRLRIIEYFDRSLSIFSNQFTILEYVEPPVANKPYATYPADSSIVASEVTFTWSVRNRDDSELKYDLYVSSFDNTRPKLVAEDLEYATYQHNVGHGVHFFWYVVAKEEDGDEIYSKEYRFRTGWGNWNVDVPMAEIGAGPYTYGEDAEILNIPYDYKMSTTEITNAVYAKWLNDLATAKADIQVSGRTITGFYEAEDEIPYVPEGRYQLLGWSASIAWNDSSEAFGIEYGYARKPVNDISWYGAKIYAQDRGYVLPTKFEWEKAAREMTGYTYPWGNNGPLCGFVNYSACGTGLWEVARYPSNASEYGLYDMAGNVWEWTESNGATQGPFFEPLIKGGAFNSDPEDLYTYNARRTNPNIFQSNIGFRVVEVRSRQ